MNRRTKEGGAVLMVLSPLVRRKKGSTMHDDPAQKKASRLETKAEVAALRQVLELGDESHLALLGRVLKQAAEENMSARDLMRLYLSIDRREGHKEQCGTTFHDTDGYKALAEAYLD